MSDLHLVGRLTDASNAAFLVRVGEEDDAPLALYKPIRGEQPLWDFPHGHLADREVAAYRISVAGGWDVVPETSLMDGPFGPGSVQRWVTDDPLSGPDTDTDTDTGADPDEVEVSGDAAQDILLVPEQEVPPGYLPVLHASLPDGRPVIVAHADIPELRAMAVFDAVINNTDRKGSHLIRDPDGRLWGVDHGVSLHTDDKLRTILWGWAGTRIPAADLDRAHALAARLDDPGDDLRAELLELLLAREVDAIRARLERLCRTARFPRPHPHWPHVPWPPL